MHCLKCKVDEVNTKLLTNCDSCKRAIHKLVCSGLNSSEIRVIELKGQRTLKYLCEDCQSGLLQVPSILTAIDQLKSEMQLLRDELNQKSTPPPHTNDNTGILNNDLFAELQDRQNRVNNIMVYNLPEQSQDRDDVISLLESLDIPDAVVKNVVRVGQPNKNGRRCLKVTFQKQEVAQLAVRSKTKLKGTNIYISPDLTKTQAEAEARVKAELRQRLSNGESDLKIKYFQGVPKIIQKN